MTGRGTTSRLTATAGAAIVAVGLTTAYGPADPAAAGHAPAIYAQSLAVELTVAADEINAATTSPHRAAAATPRANASGVNVDNLARAAALIVLTPLWYAAFPITLPSTIGLLYFTRVAISCISACGVGIDPAATLGMGIGAWAVGPFILLQQIAKGVFPTSNSVPAGALHRGATRPAAAQPARQDRDKPGTAGSRRSARGMPVSHRTIKETSSRAGEQKPSSGRGMSKRGH